MRIVYLLNIPPPLQYRIVGYGSLSHSTDVTVRIAARTFLQVRRTFPPKQLIPGAEGGDTAARYTVLKTGSDIIPGTIPQ
jgi:hypothetical protein